MRTHICLRLRVLNPYPMFPTSFELERSARGLSGHLRERLPDNLLCGDVHHVTRLKGVCLCLSALCPNSDSLLEAPGLESHNFDTLCSLVLFCLSEDCLPNPTA